MAFKDLGDWSELGGLELPISGKLYRLPPISAELGPRLQAIVAFGVEVHEGKTSLSDEDKIVLDDIGERDLYRDILHPCEKDDEACQRTPESRCSQDIYQEMVDDRVPWPALKHAAMTSMFDAVFDRDTAEKYWASPGKAPAPNRVQRRASKPSATASKTKTASTGGTTSRRSTSSKGKATSGRKSSGTGT